MKTKLNNLQDKIIASYWFLPSVMCGLALLAAWLAQQVGDSPAAEAERRWLAWAGVTTAAGGREILSTIASSTITLAGVVFSITVLTLSFASSQYGPRLLRNFVRDKPSQFVLGAFLATHVYCLVSLRSIGSDSDGQPLPHLAIAGGLVLGLANVAVLIFFVHHLARSIQVSSIVHAVGRDLAALIREFDRTAADTPPQVQTRAFNLERWPSHHVIESPTIGYVQVLAREDLLESTVEARGDLVLHVRPGDYVAVGLRLATLGTDNGDVPRRLLDCIRSAIVIGVQRTNEQDLEFPIDQLAEIAVRALSPGVNDPFTAILCIDQLGASLTELAQCRWPTAALVDREGNERVRLLPTTMHRLLHRAFEQILHFGAANPAIGRQVMKMLAQIAERSAPAHRGELGRFADHVLEQLSAAGSSSGLTDLHEQHQRLRAAIALAPR